MLLRIYLNSKKIFGNLILDSQQIQPLVNNQIRSVSVFFSGNILHKINFYPRIDIDYICILCYLMVIKSERKRTMKMKKLTSLLLCFAMLISLGGFQTYAVDADNWSSYFDEYSGTYGNVLMNPGSNDSERNFSWYSAKGSKNCKVLISENEDMSNSVSFGGKVSSTPESDCVNKVTVTGLKENTKYYYQCVNSKGESAVKSFSTIDGNSFTAMYVTDIHVTYEEDGMENSLKTESGNVNRLLTAAASKKNIDLVISAGDQASYGLRSEYVSLLASPLWSSIPFALCPGNHDRKGFDYKYFNNNPNKYTKGISSYIANDYWYVKGDVLFLVFDSNCFAAATHRAFARDAAAKNPDVKWKVAAFHHDMYGVMSEKRMTYSKDYLRPIFGEICDEIGVDLVFTGHTHHYTMSNAVFGTETTDSIEGKDSITDPRGTIYMVSSSINHPRGEENTRGDVFDENIGYIYLSDEVIYNLVDFTEDSITVSSYTIYGSEPFRTFTINKTSKNGGHPQYSEKEDLKSSDFKMEFKAFFEELGIAIKVIFNRFEILKKQDLI